MNGGSFTAIIVLLFVYTCSTGDTLEQAERIDNRRVSTDYIGSSGTTGRIVNPSRIFDGKRAGTFKRNQAGIIDNRRESTDTFGSTSTVGRIVNPSRIFDGKRAGTFKGASIVEKSNGDEARKNDNRIESISNWASTGGRSVRHLENIPVKRTEDEARKNDNRIVSIPDTDSTDGRSVRHLENIPVRRTGIPGQARRTDNRRISTGDVGTDHTNGRSVNSRENFEGKRTKTILHGEKLVDKGLG